MRKPRRLPPEELVPYQWEPPGGFRTRWGSGKPVDEEFPPSPLEGIGSEGKEAGSKFLSWPDLFGNANPVEIEVGFGKGMFLLSAATANPQRNFFGIEIIRKYQQYATTRIAGRKLPNVRTCCADAKHIFRDYVSPGSVDAVHVYFPDPWWKTRHRKRLLFTTEFADLILRVLRPGGVLYFATDVAEYFEMATGLLKALPAFTRLPSLQEQTPAHDLDYLTNFERKFRKQGKAIYRASYRKE